MEGEGLQMMTPDEHSAAHRPLGEYPGPSEFVHGEDVPPTVRLARYLEDMRRLTNEAADVARDANEGELYCRFKAWVGEMDGLRVVLSEREGER